MGSRLLSSSGIVSSSQADAIFSAGSKLSKSVQAVTEEQEYYLGRAVAATILAKYRIVNDQALTLYVNKVGAYVAAYSARPEIFGGYHFAVLDTNDINAVSAPGGFIFVSKGFLNILTSEDQLAAVLAHEVGHVVLQHGLSAISESNLSDAVKILGKEALASSQNASVTELNSLFGSSVQEITGALLDKGYSRSQEYEADAYAVQLLKLSGYNANSVKAVLTRLEHAPNQQSGWFATHPSPQNREEELPAVKDSGVNDSTAAGESARTARFQRLLEKLT